ncbi:intraflagellar transport protein 140 homolog [Culicoides brevitarsis]|uniref:intraflagellar transport protein 140 homolog n=1 Tax=Culicoides brevitarsis TaxID=469753 RepID=UPI00307B9C16
MTLFFDTKVQFLDEKTISTVSDWHPIESLFAVASYSQDKGGSVTIFNDLGQALPDISYPFNSISQSTAVRWHPEKILLISGWENGELHVWYENRRDFALVKSPHQSPIILLEFSEQGGRFVTADSMGVLIGWRCDSNSQMLTMFTHDLKEHLLHITFRKTVASPVSAELSNLARAAVGGDESALDTLTNWRPKTAARNLAHSGVKDNHCFFAGTQSGILYYINQGGTCTEVFKSDNSPITQILWHEKREAIVALMEDMSLVHFSVSADGTLNDVDRVKLSGRIPGHTGEISWAATDVLAIIIGDFTVRVWNIMTSETQLLETNLPENGPPAANQIFTCIAYCKESNTLCAGSNQGNLFTWKRIKSQNFDETWQLSNITRVRGAIKHCLWGVCDTNKSCILVNCISNCFILKEQELLSLHNRSLSAVAKTATQLNMEDEKGVKGVLTTDYPITDVCVNETDLVCTNGRQVYTYRIEKVSSEDQQDSYLKVTLMGSFQSESRQIFIYDKNVAILNNNEAKIVSLSGVMLQELHFNDTEGKPIGMDLTNNWCTVFSMNGYIKVYDIAKHEPQLLITRNGYDLFENFGEVMYAKANATGTYLAMTIANENLIPDRKLYLWNIEKDKVMFFDFMDAEMKIPKLPISFYWDEEDSRFLACQTKTIHSKKHENLTPTIADEQISIVFVTDRDEFGISEEMDLTSNEKLINLCVPHVVTLKITTIQKHFLRDFRGIEFCDEATRKTVLNFSLNVALGKMDEAFGCIRTLNTQQSNSVWNNLAKMCVTTQRLDLAKICLGQLKMARSVRAVRKAMEDNSLEQEAKMAVLAIELNMLDEAKELYKKCGRYDLLNRLHQAMGEFDEAVKVAEEHDRIHLKNTYYKYAEWFREKGDIQNALQYYEQSMNPTHNVTQMLMEDPQALKKYMQKTTDKNLLKWWAKYVESTGDMDTAFKIYQKAEDWFSQVRILCFLGQLNKAEAIAKQYDDRAGCYHLARHYENMEKYQEAINFYTRAKTYGNAIRICKENDLQTELWNVASVAQAADKASAAAYFEEIGDYGKAVELYHKAGMISQAVEMAFASQQPETLQVIAAELDNKSDPELVQRCAEFFIDINQNQKAVLLLSNSRQFQKALEIVSSKGVPLTETLADLLTPDKEELDEHTRTDILIQLGDILQQQGDYQMATKKFTQAGDKIRAMKSLLKSGDRDKIIYFASMSRQKEVYIMAANYLQGLDYQSDGKVLKHIVQFYTKAQAYDLLSNFYARAAQIEVNEFRDYKKALTALQEAAKTLTKVPNTVKAQDTLQLTIAEVRKVLEIYDLYEHQEFTAVINEARNLLMNTEKPPIRHVHVMGLLVEALISTKQYQEALGLLRELVIKTSDGEFREFLDKGLVQRLTAELGVDFEAIWNVNIRQKSFGDESEGEEIAEEVE